MNRSKLMLFVWLARLAPQSSVRSLMRHHNQSSLWLADAHQAMMRRNPPDLHLLEWPLERPSDVMARMIIEMIRCASRPSGISRIGLTMVADDHQSETLDAGWKPRLITGSVLRLNLSTLDLTVKR